MNAVDLRRRFPRATVPLRGVKAGVRVARAGLRGLPAILMYHHIADTPTDPWQLAVSPDNFAGHLDVLRRSRRPVVTLDHLVRSIEAGEPIRRAVVITFDDGYADNALVALPLLERAGLPATVFVTTGTIGSLHEMWWDALERVILSTPELPDTLDITIADDRVTVRLDDEGPAGRGWWATADAPSTQREVLYLDLWSRLSPLSHAAQRSILEELATWAGVDISTARETHRLMTDDELVRLAASDVIEVGSHTVNHPSLTNVASSTLDAELRGSRADLEARTGRQVTTFAYPSGHHDDEVAAAVSAAGYRAAATTRGAPVRTSDDVFNLPRFVVRDQGRRRFAAFIAQHG